jgi:hypothetical protein
VTATGASDGPAGPSDAGGSERAAGDAPADLRTQPPDAAPDVPPVGVGNVDGVPCAAGITCASGLCGAGGHCLPKYQWSRALPNGGCATWIVVAPDGDLVVLGGAATGSGALGLFIEKVDGDLNLIWRHTFGLVAGGMSSIPQPAVLADGTVVFAVDGQSVMFDSGQLVLDSTADILTVLVALSSAGSYQWIKTYARPLDATEDQVSIAALAANPGGGMSVAGQLSGQVNLDFAGGAAGMESVTTSSVFVAQYDVAGKLGLAKTYSSSSSSGSTILLAAANFTPFLGVAPDGSMYLGGGFSGTGAFGSSPAPYPGAQFIAHLGAAGSLTAAGSWVDMPPGIPPSLAMASDGALFESSSTAFVRVDATTGGPQWSFPTPGWFISHVAARASVVVTGEFDQATDFDFGPGQALYQPQGPSDAPYPTSFMAGYDEAGALQWVREPTVPTSNAVTIGLDGAIYYLNGGTSSLTDFDPGPGVDPMQAPFNSNMCFITKYAAP